MDLNQLKEDLSKCAGHLRDELAQIRTGRVTPELIEPVKVEAYNTTTPLKNLGNITVADPKSLVVQVWDKTIVDSIAKGIEAANLGLSVAIEGDRVRATMGDMSEERRKDMVKVMKERVETARIAVRNVRRDYMKLIEEQVKAGELPEDAGERFKGEIEKEVKAVNERIEELRESKEKDLMTT